MSIASTSPDPRMPTLPGYPPPPRSEARWPPLLVVMLAIALQLALPSRLIPGPRWLFPALEALVLVVLFTSSPQRVVREHAPRRRLSVLVTGLASLANAISLVLLASNMLRHNVTQGKLLVIAGFVIWLTNVLLFSLWFWELDRGGPGRRAAGHDGPPDFLFPQMTDDRLSPGWRPLFLDYLYTALTNATAFSPTDTMPLTGMSKSLMGLQSLVSLVTIGLVVSRAVNIL